jgi:hypothetical protein
MDSTNLLPLLEQLDDNVDDLEDVLQPLLSSSLLKSSNKLPVMDKAKLHVLITYTLESLIFCMSPFETHDFIVLITYCSLSATSWRGCQAAPGVPGTDPCEAVL